jgi:hypothetical protein
MVHHRARAEAEPDCDPGNRVGATVHDACEELPGRQRVSGRGVCNDRVWQLCQENLDGVRLGELLPSGLGLLRGQPGQQTLGRADPSSSARLTQRVAALALSCRSTFAAFGDTGHPLSDPVEGCGRLVLWLPARRADLTECLGLVRLTSRIRRPPRVNSPVRARRPRLLALGVPLPRRVSALGMSRPSRARAGRRLCAYL